MTAKSVDYTLYLVTDSTPAILGNNNLFSIVEAAISGGVTIVQLRDKKSDSATLVRVAQQLHTITQSAQIPLLINDRVDVALAAGVEGVHIGQDDIDLKSARRILGENAIIGVTVNNSEEALVAARDGADYLGIGTVFATSTKEDTKAVIGIVGVREILASLADAGLNLHTVSIGGINAKNIQRVLYQSRSTQKALDGVAVVSAIIASTDAQKAAQGLRALIRAPPPFALPEKASPLSVEMILHTTPIIVRRVAQHKPLCHNMTNLVVQNLAANVALAIGSSPIMSNNGSEAADLAALGGSLVINMGTTTTEIRKTHLEAISAYNSAARPIILDPVGAGATTARREGVKALMAGGYFDVIKGNESEILTVAGSFEAKQHGVDAGTSGLSLAERIEIVKRVAVRERNIILMTGSTDIISDGQRTIMVSNGDKMLGEVTGSGCTLGTTIASFLAVEREERLLATIAGVLMFEIAAERAMSRTDVHGPGSFVPAFLDALYLIRCETLAGNNSWVQDAKIQIV